MVRVRAATVADLPELLRLGRAMHAETPRYAHLSWSDEKIETLLRGMVQGTLVTDPPGGALVAVKASKIIGVLGAHVTTYFFSHDKVASDFIFFVVPEQRRKGRAAVALMQAFEAWADEQGAVDIAPGVSSMIDIESTERFYAKLGYTKCGSLFSKRRK